MDSPDAIFSAVSRTLSVSPGSATVASGCDAKRPRQTGVLPVWTLSQFEHAISTAERDSCRHSFVRTCPEEPYPLNVIDAEMLLTWENEESMEVSMKRLGLRNASEIRHSEQDPLHASRPALLSIRAAVVLLAAFMAAGTALLLTLATGASLAPALLAGGAAFSGALGLLDRIISDRPL
jgi:hypothetical protein